MTTREPGKSRRVWPYLVIALGLIALWLIIGRGIGSDRRTPSDPSGRSHLEPATAGRTARVRQVSLDTRFLLRGQVVFPDGKPVPGAEVVIQTGPGPLPGSPLERVHRDGAIKASADADGAFRFESLRAGSYMLGATHGDDVAPTTPAVVGPDALPVTLVVLPGAGLEVLVRSGSKRGAPLVGATVRVTEGDRGFGEQWSFRVAQTDARGIAKFRGLIATANHLIAASAIGHVETTHMVHDSELDGRAWTAEIVLPPAAQLSGRVIDSNGRGVEGAVVGWVLGAEPREPDAVDLFYPLPFRDKVGVARTDAEGRFSLSAEAGSGCLRGEHREYETGETCGLTLEVGKERSGVEVLLRDGARVGGTVVWPDGTPAMGATVIATKLGWGHQPMFSKVYRFETRTGADGRFAFRGIRRSQFELTAFTDDASSGLVSVDLTGRSEQRDIKITLTNEGTIRGRVVDEAKNPVAYAAVEYFIDPTAEPPAAEGTPRTKRRFEALADHPGPVMPRGIGATRADANGQFEIKGLPDGFYVVRATRPEVVDVPTAMTSTTEEAVGVGETIEIVLRGIGGVKGRVVSESGRPVPGFAVAIGPGDSGGRGPVAAPRTITSSDGTFMLGAVPAGSYRLRIGGGDLVELYLPAPVKIVAGKVVDLGTLRVTTGTRRRGVVLTKDRKPAAAVTVTALTATMAGPVGTKTESDGTFVLPAIERGQSIQMRADADTATSGWVVVPPTTTNIELVLAIDGVGSIVGTLVESGAPLDRRTIVLTDVGDGTPDEPLQQRGLALTSSGGTFRIDRVQEGEYLIWVMRASRLKEVGPGKWWKLDKPIRVAPQRETHAILAVPPRTDGGGTDVGGGQGRAGGTGSGGTK